MNLPHDLTHEVQALHRARVRARRVAWAGAICLALLGAYALGTLSYSAHGIHRLALMGAIAIYAWGTISLRHLLSRY